MSVSLRFTKEINYNIKHKITNPDVLQEQIRRTKHTLNQNQRLLKVLIEKVDSIQNLMIKWFETKQE